VQPKVNRVVMAVEPPSIESNEPRNIGQPPMWQIKPMYEYLIGIDPVNGKLTPELATDWSMDPKTLAVTFKLRSGVQFHNGYGEFGAKDVLYSWQDLTQKDSFHTQAQYWRDIIKGIDTPNEREAVLHLSAVDGGFLGPSPTARARWRSAARPCSPPRALPP
jgi:ABC-type transport system substrate-binding protein